MTRGENSRTCCPRCASPGPPPTPPGAPPPASAAEPLASRAPCTHCVPQYCMLAARQEAHHIIVSPPRRPSWGHLTSPHAHCCQAAAGMITRGQLRKRDACTHGSRFADMHAHPWVSKTCRLSRAPRHLWQDTLHSARASPHSSSTQQGRGHEHGRLRTRSLCRLASTGSPFSRRAVQVASTTPCTALSSAPSVQHSSCHPCHTTTGAACACMARAPVRELCSRPDPARCPPPCNAACGACARHPHGKPQLHLHRLDTGSL